MRISIGFVYTVRLWENASCISFAVEHKFTSFRYHTNERSYPSAANSATSGLCTGTLAAAAVCCSTSVSNLLPAAVQSVVVAFRIGYRAVEVGRTISAVAEPSCIWSMMCVGMTVNAAREVIEAFLSTKVRPLCSNNSTRAYCE